MIDQNNNNLGVMHIRDALDRAAEAELDLVEVAPQADPPVCRILDYGKFQYEQAKKERLARKAQKITETKEVRLRSSINDHHLGFKVRDARRWLQEGMKVKFRIRFRGREITYPEIARDQLMRIAEELSDVAIVEAQPDMEGRTMLMIMGPRQ